jgi:secondary thiamine-phosphate synthase enzyme
MPIINEYIELETQAGINVHNLTEIVKTILVKSKINNGYVIVCCQHTTTAIAINEYEERLLADLKTYLNKLAPARERYLHNDLHLRDVPPDEPKNAHSHLLAMTLNNSEIIPIIEGNLALGTWQSILLIELDGPRHRKALVQINGEQY